MAVVSNTSPLLNLAIIGRLSLLEEQFSEVLIPPAVLRELRPEEALPGSELLAQALRVGWLRATALTSQDVANVLWRTLDEGEAEAIALALQLGADRVLLDERDGRRAALAAGLRPVGALGVLLRAKRDGAIPSLRQDLDRLRELAAFRIAAELERDLLRAAGELT
jgi:predicted nucleic acid-binding protein